MEKKNLPSIKNVYKGDLAELKTTNDLNLLLNQKPNDKWIKTHPFAKEVKYLTIQRVEYLLTAIFIKWRVEIKQLQILANSIVTTIRLHYKDPVTGEWDWQDGVGAAPIQTDKGSGAIEFNSMKNDAVMKAAPAAKSFAVKDAAHNLGKLFGKDLIRKDEVMYDSLKNKFPDSDKEALFNK